MTTTSTTEFASTADGLSQLRRTWSVASPRASALIVHGIGEHSGRYEHVGAALASAGIDTLAFDNRGFGQSGGTRAHVDSFDDYVGDVEDLLALRREGGVPVILIGHSLGGLIASTYLVSDRPQPDLAVLSAPALAAEVPGWQRRLAPVVSRFLPTQHIPSKIDATLLSRDEAVQRAYVDDPLVISGATGRLGSEIFATMEATTASIDRLRVPTYVLHGADDRLVPPTASEPLSTVDGVTRRVWDGVRHEAFNEPEQDAVIGEMIAWIESELDQLDGSSST